MDEYNKDMFWCNFLGNYWWVLLLACIISPIFNGGWLLIVISIGLVIYSIYKMIIVEDKYDSSGGNITKRIPNLAGFRN